MPTLEEVEAAFCEWRTVKKKKWERVPDELISMAKSLVGEYPIGTVSFRLGIRARKLEVAKEVQAPAIEEKFIEVPNDIVTPAPTATPITVRVRPGRKNEISISVPANDVNWQELLKGLSKL